MQQTSHNAIAALDAIYASGTPAAPTPVHAAATASAPAIDLERIAAIVARNRNLAGALLPILHDIQDAVGYVPPESVPLIADALNLSRAEVHGVVSYYHHFRQQKAATHTLQICRAEACQARGAAALIAHVKATLGCDFHGTSDDGRFTLEPVYCLGLCANGPNLMLDETLHAHVTERKFDRLVAADNVDNANNAAAAQAKAAAGAAHPDRHERSERLTENGIALMMQRDATAGAYR